MELLADLEVGYIFGNPGSTEVPILDQLVDRSTPKFILTLHESIAAAMADAYAQLSGKPGVVCVHATPGVANIVGGLFLAKSHFAPVMVIAGQQDSRLLGRRPFLASDVVSLTRQYVKGAFEVARAEDVASTLRHGFDLAMSAPQGPVLVSIPRDFYEVEVQPPTAQVSVAAISQGRSEVGVREADVRKAVELLMTARNPIILSGNGVGLAGSEAIEAVVALAESTGSRVFSEHNAVNMHFPGDHRQYLGGNAHGMSAFRPWLQGADLVVAIGCDLFMEDVWSSEPLLEEGTAVIQIDPVETEIGRLVPVDVALVADVIAGVSMLTAAVRAASSEEALVAIRARRQRVEQTRRKLEAERERIRRERWDAYPISMVRVYSELRRMMKPEDLMVDEAVNMASYLHDFFPLLKPNTFLSSKQSWLGWGWGAALGAQLARPEVRVVACLGDGSASFTIQALWTAQKYRIPITAVILNNGGYMAVQNHLRGYGHRAAKAARYPGTDIGGIDFVRLAAGYGVQGRLVQHPDDLAAALEWALATSGPSLVEVLIDPDDPGLGRRPIERSL
jgi:benzoylformate decarboxylase